jgi:uncharacterized membrane protein YgaE (UPF0421/DUF939 family)
MRRDDAIVLGVCAVFAIPIVALLVSEQGIGMAVVSVLIIGAGSGLGVVLRRRLNRR